MKQQIFSSEHFANLSKALVFVTTFLVGDITTAVVALASMLILDYSTGVVAAMVNGSWNSTISVRGIALKFGFLAIVGAAFHLGELLGAPQVFRKAFIIIFVVHEFGSILENVNKMGSNNDAVPERVYKLADRITEETT